MSSYREVNLNQIRDQALVPKAIIRRLYTALYFQNKEARFNGSPEWLDLNEIILAYFEKDEQKLVKEFLPRFKQFYAVKNLIIENNNVKLTQEGREIIKFYFLDH